MKYYWVVGSPVGLEKLGGFEPSAREKINTPFILDFFKIKPKGGVINNQPWTCGKTHNFNIKIFTFQDCFPW